ncbi:hypothetical protein GCM10023185_31040 [Hymenobacter saemangeumensis]|uniref:Uncharacterized protein n=1 Tax=Hymenobacter saemangeumensis TaxID=1084522 RepID=A0ABP8ILV1_9BACT
MALAYTQELLDRAEAYIGTPLTERRQAEGLAELAGLYAAIRGEAPGSCRQCQYADYFRFLTSYIREATRVLHPDLMADSKYTFAPGFENETLVHESYGKAVTLDTLTDDDAKALRKLGFDKIIIEKGAKPAASQEEADKKAESEAVAKAKADTKTAKDALKAEKDAHAATQKQLAQLQKDYAGLEKQLAEATKPQEGDAQ